MKIIASTQTWFGQPCSLRDLGTEMLEDQALPLGSANSHALLTRSHLVSMSFEVFLRRAFFPANSSYTFAASWTDGAGELDPRVALVVGGREGRPPLGAAAHLFRERHEENTTWEEGVKERSMAQSIKRRLTTLVLYAREMNLSANYASSKM